MNRQIFKALPFEEQLKYVNARPNMTTKEIANEIGIPPSTLTNIFSRAGYKRENGKYVTLQPNFASTADPLEELLQYKDQILSLVIGQHQPQNINLDFTPLQQFPKDDGKESISFEMPKKLAKRFNEIVDKRGYKKQSLLCLLIYQFLDNDKG